MLKMAGRGMRNGKPVKMVVLGLSHVNLTRLQEGKPITFNGEEVSVPDVEFYIFAGETEQSMARELEELVGPSTRTKIDPRLRD